MNTKTFNALFLLFFILLGQSCKVLDFSFSKEELQFSENRHSRSRIQNINTFDVQIPIIQKEFEPLCLGCHDPDYQDEYAPSKIFDSKYIKDSLIYARNPIENRIIKKIMENDVHDGGILCNNYFDPECASLIVAWIELNLTKGSRDLSKLSNIKVENNILAYGLAKNQQLYIFEGLPLSSLTFKNIILSTDGRGKVELNRGQILIEVKGNRTYLYSLKNL